MNNWKIDKDSHIAKHHSGFEVEIQGNEVINIISIPKGLKTAELPSLLREAVKAYQSASRPQQPRPKNKPKRPILSLKR